MIKSRLRKVRTKVYRPQGLQSHNYCRHIKYKVYRGNYTRLPDMKSRVFSRPMSTNYPVIGFIHVLLFFLKTLCGIYTYHIYIYDIYIKEAILKHLLNWLRFRKSNSHTIRLQHGLGCVSWRVFCNV